MTAKILARTADNALTEFWINDDVIRVGSAADCDLPLGGISPHAVTVQRRGNAYFVFNRSSAPMNLAGKTLSAGGSCGWQTGEELELGAGVVLLLQPAEVALRQAPLLAGELDDNEPAAEDAPQPAVAKNNMSVVILGVCLVGIVFLLTAGGRPNGGKNTTVEFEDVIQEYTWEHSINDPTARRILDGVQRARIAELRRDKSLAKQEYGEAKDLLWTKKQSANGVLSDVDEQMLSFITERLPRLQ